MNKVLCEINPIYPVKDILPNGDEIYTQTTMELCKREILDAMLYGTVDAVENNERIRFVERDKVDSIIKQIIEKRNTSKESKIDNHKDEYITHKDEYISNEVIDDSNEVLEDTVEGHVEDELQLEEPEVVKVEEEVVKVEETSNSIPYKSVPKNNKNNKKK